MSRIDISGVDKGALLAELYNNAQVMGMGIFQAHRGPQVMSYAEGTAIIKAALDGHTPDDNASAFPGIQRADHPLYFDYLFGRCLKVDLSPELDDESREWCETWGYDRDWGEGAFEAAVERAKAGTSPSTVPPAEPVTDPDEVRRIIAANPIHITTWSGKETK